MKEKKKMKNGLGDISGKKRRIYQYFFYIYCDVYAICKQHNTVFMLPYLKIIK